MERFCFIEPTNFYNLIQQKTVYPSLSDNNFLLILDARDSDDYAESHIITAKLAPRMQDGQWKVPYYAELECKQHIVVYDGNTCLSLSEEAQGESPAISLARFLVAHGSKNSVLIVNGGYENFSALYPFLRTKKILYMPKELDVVVTYPTEIIPARVYMGNLEQALDKRIQKDLKIGAHVAVTKHDTTYFNAEDSSKLLRVAIEDDISEDLLSHLGPVCSFIDRVNDNEARPVLIYSDLGISRNAAVAIAFLIHKLNCPLKDAWDHVLECDRRSRPNRGFVKQLSQWEQSQLGETKTTIDDPAF